MDCVSKERPRRRTRGRVVDGVVGDCGVDERLRLREGIGSGWEDGKGVVEGEEVSSDEEDSKL